jgi:predicted phosphate transport protein (TIGR00153 family)
MIIMARKKRVDYFETFVNLVEYTCQAAELLKDIMTNYNMAELKEKMAEMHTIEHAADTERHKMIHKLLHEFITPIEREDIMAMADAIDNVTDTIEDVVMRLYMFNIQKIRDNAVKMTDIVVKCCYALKKALKEFHNFHKSQKLHSLIVEINMLEEEGDRLFTEATRDLYVNCRQPIEVLAWDQTYSYLESCCDACEDVADVIENVVMKNT